MADSLYNLYIADTVMLARTLIVKCEATADAMNAELEAIGNPVDVYSPHTWKYYLNLNGQYHTVDEPMYITSIDTLENIPFTKESLVTHRTTKKEYTFASTYYNELVAKYPLQENLIRGILNPIDMDTAIDAVNYEILYYSDTLVESGEVNLIPRLKRWIQAHMLRWDITSYRDADDLYAASTLAVMFANIPNAILNIRLDNCKTDMVHTYHLWTYLRGKSSLDKYRRSLTHSQALFLYRNIVYIHDNAGKGSTFQLLIDRMLTERGIPLYAFDIQHSLESQPENIRPDIEMIRYPLNVSVTGVGIKRKSTVEYILDKTSSLATDNPFNIPEIAATIEYKTKTSGKNNLKTKVLESIINDGNDLQGVTLIEILMEQWAFLASENIYVANLLVPNPHTGEILQLTPMDAFILYLKVYNITVGSNLENIPEILVRNVAKLTLPSMEEILSVIEPRFVNLPVITELLNKLPSVSFIINNLSFYEHCEAIFTVYNGFRDIYLHHPTLHGTAQIREVLNRIKDSRMIKLSDTLDYDTWLYQNDIDLENISTSDAVVLAQNLYEAGTGIDNDGVVSLGDIQSDMIDILDMLTSYDIQFIKTIVGENAFGININEIRMSDLYAVGAHHIGDLDNAVRVVNETAKIKQELGAVKIPGLEITDHTTLYDLCPIPTGVEITFRDTIHSLGRIRLPNLHFKVKEQINDSPS